MPNSNLTFREVWKQRPAGIIGLENKDRNTHLRLRFMRLQGSLNWLDTNSVATFFGRAIRMVSFGSPRREPVGAVAQLARHEFGGHVLRPSDPLGTSRQLAEAEISRSQELSEQWSWNAIRQSHLP